FCTRVRTYTVLQWKQGTWTSQGLDPLGQEEVASNRTAGTGVLGPGVGRRSTCACCRPGPGPLARVHDSYRGAALARDDRPYRTERSVQSSESEERSPLGSFYWRVWASSGRDVMGRTDAVVRYCQSLESGWILGRRGTLREKGQERVS
ncbi:hypothetical protein CSPX01_13464, partial [Colletotrichum filicis]